MVRKENTEPRMRVIPAYDARVRKLRVLHLVYMGPGFLCEGDMCSSLRCILTRDAFGNTDRTIVSGTNKHSTDLTRFVCACVLPDSTDHFAIDHYGQDLVAGCSWFRHA